MGEWGKNWIVLRNVWGDQSHFHVVLVQFRLALKRTYIFTKNNDRTNERTNERKKCNDDGKYIDFSSIDTQFECRQLHQINKFRRIRAMAQFGFLLLAGHQTKRKEGNQIKIKLRKEKIIRFCLIFCWNIVLYVFLSLSRLQNLNTFWQVENWLTAGKRMLVLYSVLLIVLLLFHCYDYIYSDECRCVRAHRCDCFSLMQ